MHTDKNIFPKELHLLFLRNTVIVDSFPTAHFSRAVHPQRRAELFYNRVLLFHQK